MNLNPKLSKANEIGKKFGKAARRRPRTMISEPAPILWLYYHYLSKYAKNNIIGIYTTRLAEINVPGFLLGIWNCLSIFWIKKVVTILCKAEHAKMAKSATDFDRIVSQKSHLDLTSF